MPPSGDGRGREMKTNGPVGPSLCAGPPCAGMAATVALLEGTSGPSAPAGGREDEGATSRTTGAITALSASAIQGARGRRPRRAPVRLLDRGAIVTSKERAAAGGNPPNGATSAPRSGAAKGLSMNKVYVVRRARTEHLEDAGSAESSATGATDDNEGRSVRRPPDGAGLHRQARSRRA